jgi:hypothetical protein
VRGPEWILQQYRTMTRQMVGFTAP